jgi:hypothetical protein
VSVNLRKVENVVVQFGKVEEVSYPALMVLLIKVAIGSLGYDQGVDGNGCIIAAATGKAGLAFNALQT